MEQDLYMHKNRVNDIKRAGSMKDENIQDVFFYTVENSMVPSSCGEASRS